MRTNKKNSVSLAAMQRYLNYCEKKLRDARKTVFTGYLAEEEVVKWKIKVLRYNGYKQDYYKEMLKQTPETTVLK